MTRKYPKTTALLVAGVVLAMSAGLSFAKESEGRKHKECKPPTPTVTIVAPVDGSQVPNGPLSVTVSYTTGQAGSVITLFEGTAAVGTFTVPCNATSGTTTFTVDLSLVPAGSAVAFQAKLCPPSRCHEGDDGEEEHHSGDRSRLLSESHDGHHGDSHHEGDDDEGDDDDGSSCVSSNIVTVTISNPNTGNT